MLRSSYDQARRSQPILSPGPSGASFGTGTILARLLHSSAARHPCLGQAAEPQRDFRSPGSY